MKFKVFLIISFLLIIYGLFSFFYETNIYKLNYPKKNDWCYEGYNDFHSELTPVYVISNPPRDKKGLFLFILENKSKISFKKDLKVILFFEEKAYLNRYFTTLDLCGLSFREALRIKDKENNEIFRIGFTEENHLPFYVLEEFKRLNIYYFPNGQNSINKEQWFVNSNKNSFKVDNFKQLTSENIDSLLKLNSSYKEAFKNFGIEN